MKAFSKIYGAKSAPSEANALINLKDWLRIVTGATCWASMENDSTINWSEWPAYAAIIIADSSWTVGSKRFCAKKSCSRNCWAKSVMKQKTFTFYCWIFGSCFGGMHKAFVKLEKCLFCNCSCCCRDLSHCCSHCCSCCGEGLRSYDVIQTGVVVIVCLKSSSCCSCCDANLQNS